MANEMIALILEQDNDVVSSNALFYDSTLPVVEPPRDPTPPVVECPPRNPTPPVVEPPRDPAPPVVEPPPRDPTPPVVESPPRDPTPPADEPPPCDPTPPVAEPLLHDPTLVQHISVQEEETYTIDAGDSSQNGVCMYVCIYTTLLLDI